MMFTTERLLVRRLDGNDVDAMFAVYGDAESMRYVDEEGGTLSREECAGWVEVTERNYAKRGYGMSAVVLREGGAVIGFCGIVHPGDQIEAEIKYAFQRGHWGAGYGTEVARGMLAHAFEAHGIRRVIATVNPANAASLHVLEKCGMERMAPRQEEDGSWTEVFACELPLRASEGTP